MVVADISWRIRFRHRIALECQAWNWSKFGTPETVTSRLHWLLHFVEQRSADSKSWDNEIWMKVVWPRANDSTRETFEKFIEWSFYVSRHLWSVCAFGRMGRIDLEFVYDRVHHVSWKKSYHSTISIKEAFAIMIKTIIILTYILNPSQLNVISQVSQGPKNKLFKSSSQVLIQFCGLKCVKKTKCCNRSYV
jgi:hypothetical protein